MKISPSFGASLSSPKLVKKIFLEYFHFLISSLFLLLVIYIFFDVFFFVAKRQTRDTTIRVDHWLNKNHDPNQGKTP